MTARLPGRAGSVSKSTWIGPLHGPRLSIDIVVVTADGCESMNLRPHGLTVLGV